MAKGRVVSFQVLADHRPAHEDTYTVWFSDDGANNINIGASNIFGAVNVEEHLYGVEYEEIRLIDGLTLPFPVAYQEHGYITIVFQEQERYKAHKFMKAWADQWVLQGAGILTDPVEMIKEVFVERLDLANNVMAKSHYMVLPPDNLRATASQANQINTNSISLKVVGVSKSLDDE